MGLPADLQVIADGMVSASMEMVTTVMPSARDTAIAVFHELDRQHGMAGDDDAGHAFEDSEDFQTTFLFYAPEEDPHGWGLDVVAFGAALAEGFPEADSGVSGRESRLGPYFSWWARTDDDIEYSGTADTAGRDCVVVGDNAIAEAARFVLWLRAHVVPSSGLIRFSSRDAVEAGLEERYWHLPDDGGLPGADEALRRHVLEVEAGGS